MPNNIPWPDTVSFHKEIVKLGEDKFFSFPLRTSDSSRFSYFDEDDFFDFSGSWKIPISNLVSTPFKQELTQGSVESLYFGLPCFLKWTKYKNNFVPNWCPIFYGELKFDISDNYINCKLVDNKWHFTPLAYTILAAANFINAEEWDDLAKNIIKSSSHRYEENLDLPESMFSVINEHIPELFNWAEIKEKIRKIDRVNDFPSSLILFKELDSVGPINQQLLKDYETLEELVKNGSLGGLKILNDEHSLQFDEQKNAKPFVSLNKSQKKAVYSILNPKSKVSVIGGPPGCGKSQVVLSALLNAWCLGKSVLFVSNNNKAVDVVRERLSLHEKGFPLSIRAGSKQHNTVNQALSQIINFAGDNNDFHQEDNNEIGKLVIQLDQKNKIKDSDQYQQISEAYKASNRALGQSVEKSGQIKIEEGLLNDKREKLGISQIYSVKDIASILEKTKSYIGQKLTDAKGEWEEQKKLVNKYNDKKEEYYNKIYEIFIHIGIKKEDVAYYYEQLKPKEFNPDFLITELNNLKHFLIEEKPEDDLLEILWKDEYNQWGDFDDPVTEAKEFSKNANKFSENGKAQISIITPKFNKIKKANDDLVKVEKEISDENINIPQSLKHHVVKEWRSRFGKLHDKLSQKNIIHLKSEAKEIFDVSGAGDTVIAAMATGLLTGANYKKVLEFSNLAAGIVVGHVGTSAITIEELLD